MSIIIPCTSWVPYMLKQIRALFVQNNEANNNNTDEVEVDLPYEIIADILGRLPPKTALLCVGACKPLLAITNTPVIAFYCKPLKPQLNGNGKNCTQVLNVFFTQNNNSGNYTITSTQVDVFPTNKCNRQKCAASLYGSCNGLLLFKHLDCDSFLFIWNPVTSEQKTVIPTRTGCLVRGFFFHPKAHEYRVLFLSLGLRSQGGLYCFDYYMYGLKTETFRLITSYSHASQGFRNPILLNGVLYCKVSDRIHKNANGVYPDCSDSILLFDIYSEKFSTMSHPGGQCRVNGCHVGMQLMKNQGHLYFCDPSSYHDIFIWRLEDFENKVWAKIHVIQEPHKVLYGIRCRPPFHGMPMAFDMHKDEVIVCVNTNIVLYNMLFCSFRRIGKQFTDSSDMVYPFYHVDSLVSLHANNDRLGSLLL